MSQNHRLKQIENYMDMALQMSDALLAKISKGSTLGLLLNKLAKVDPGPMQVHLKKAMSIAARTSRSKSRPAAARKSKRAQEKLNNDKRPSKKTKFTAPSMSQNQEQDLSDDQVRGRPTSRNQTSTKALLTERPGTGATDIGNQTSSSAFLIGPPDAGATEVRTDELPEANPADGDAGSIYDTAPNYYSSIRYTQETGVTGGTPAVVDPLIEICLEKFQDVGKSKKAKEDLVVEVFRRCEQLDFETTRFALWRFLCNRREVLDRTVEVRPLWKIEDVIQALDTIQSLDDSGIDLNIRHIYTQMRLFTLVQDHIKTTSLAPAAFLNSLADQKALSTESFRDGVYRKNKYNASYAAGKRWYDVCSWFGGDAIVLVFVLADIPRDDISHKWALFQLLCLKHLSQYFYSIRRLVEKLGGEALEYYCQHGQLSDEVRDGIENFDGYE